MTDRELERKLADAVTRAAPDDLDAILSRCGARNGSVTELKELRQNQTIIDVDAVEVEPKKRWGRWLAAACAALALLGAGGGGLVYQNSYAVASVVSLDVNPSIELKVNRKEKVLSCTALNEEAAAVLFSMGGGADLEGAKLEVAVNAIVGALVREGYLSRISSAILISVEDKDQDRAARLQQELVATVDGVLQTQAPGANVLSQVLTDAGTNYTNYNTSISSGKASLVHKVMEMNGTVVFNDVTYFDQIAALSVEELNDLLKTGEKRIPIGKDAAALAVDEYAGTTALSSPYTDVDPELDETPPHYDVELHTAWGEFDYMVDAFTGEILSGPKDVLSLAPGNSGSTQQPSNTAPETPEVNTQTPAAPDPAPQAPNTNTNTQKPNSNTNTNTNTSAQSQDVGREAAKKAALANAGLTESQVTGLKIERDWDDGRLEYEIEFWCGSVEYECTIDGSTGSVLKSGMDHHGSGNSTDVGQAAAKAAALSHAGLTESQVTGWEIERDWDDGRLEYELEFWCGTTEYEYTIDGHTCAVLEHEVDYHTSGTGHHSDSHH